MRKELLRKLDIRLSKVILLRDAFSGEALTGGMQIRTFQGDRPVLKPGGYCLFINMAAEEFDVEIESPVYQTRRLLLRADHGEEVEEVFLYPSAAYPLKNHTTVVLGNVRPGSVLRFHLEEEADECRLLCDYQEEEKQISIFTKKKPGSRIWFIKNREKKAGEYFQIRPPFSGSEQCRLTKPLKTGYRKRETSLYPAYECIADENGDFYLPLDRLRDRKYKLYYDCKEAEKESSGKADILGTRQNIITGKQKEE